MSDIAFVNGRFVEMQAAQVNIEDRGYQFADGAYEVCAIARGKLVDGEPHVRRLQRSLGELKIPCPELDIAALSLETARRNEVEWGIVYIQVTRGVAPRNHAFPKKITPAVVITSRRFDYEAVFARINKGVSVISTPEIRWRRCDIKSIALLPNVMAKQEAQDAGAFEAWYVKEDGIVTEGASTNAWIVKDDKVITHPGTNAILSGIVRQTVIDLIRKESIEFEERPFSLDEARQADGAFSTSTTACVTPITSIDGITLGGGKINPLIKTIAGCYKDYLYAVTE